MVEVFAANQDQPRDRVIELMTEKILAIGPEKISMHMSDTHYTFDVAPSSIPREKHAAFVAAVVGNKAVSKLIQPPRDRGVGPRRLRRGPAGCLRTGHCFR